MPTTYAHDVFGKTVYQKLPEEIREAISEHGNAYRIGLQGPDILFYYKPFKKNPVNQRGHQMHKEKAADFFERCRKQYQKEESECLLAYTLGAMCHYMLDSTCHPYISKYMEKSGAAHDEIETEFDRMLMISQSKNPFRYRPARQLKADKETVKEISGILEETSECQVQRAVRSLKFYTGLTVCNTRIKRKLLLNLLRIAGLYDSMQGHIMRKRPSKRCRESTEQLYALAKLAVPETVTVIQDYYQNLTEEEYSNGRFERTYE